MYFKLDVNDTPMDPEWTQVSSKLSHYTDNLPASVSSFNCSITTYYTTWNHVPEEEGSDTQHTYSYSSLSTVRSLSYGPLILDEVILEDGTKQFEGDVYTSISGSGTFTYNGNTYNFTITSIY